MRPIIQKETIKAHFCSECWDLIALYEREILFRRDSLAQEKEFRNIKIDLKQMNFLCEELAKESCLNKK
jgi:hypothetical protein